MTIEHAERQISAIVQRWQSLSPADVRQYNEENTKNVFIQPLFEALGWNFHDIEEVTAEHAAAQGRVDYAFRVNGVSRFYLEAKPLRTELSSGPDWVRQAVGYAYSKGIPWVILTNFKDFWGYTGDGDRRFITMSAADYAAHIDRLWLLSKESVSSGLLERELALEGAIPPSIPIEQRLYGQLREWRETLFNQINQYNRELSLEAVDETIQKLFNRLIFIRTAEDRGIEERRLLAALRQHRDGTLGHSLLEELRDIFEYYDRHYDSDLFSRHALDGPSGGVFIEDPTLEDTIQGLYEVPGGLVSYDFAAIDADILGAVYEQYLGHVTQIVRRRAEEIQLRMEQGSTYQQAWEEAAQVIARPVRRRNQGIYYTPKWVTDYIVGETVGRFITENAETPEAIQNVKILDMACGSGSFLIRAYDELLRWHSEGSGRNEADIDVQERTDILRSNIYGVDLDSQAVEVARLNLMLRALARRENLPSLSDNLKTGNSLISGSEDELEAYFGDDWEANRSFEWEREFEPIMADDGFDIIIGNPPYVQIQDIDKAEKDYFRKKYKSPFGSFDLYVVFLEKAIRLLKPTGRLGFITSGKFLKNEYGKKIRQILKTETTIEQIIDLSELQVFPDATTYPIIVVFKKGAVEQNIIYRRIADESEFGIRNLATASEITAQQEAINEGVWPPPTPENRRLIDKIESVSDTLGDISTNIFVGIQTGANPIYYLERRNAQATDTGMIIVFSEVIGRDVEIESMSLKALLKGRHIRRYYTEHADNYLIFPYQRISDRMKLISPSEYSENYPLCWNYLLANREKLEGRENGKMRHENWYGYTYPKNLARQEIPKLTIPAQVNRLTANYDLEGKFYLDNVRANGILLRDTSEDNYLYVLALLNSKLVNWRFHQISSDFRGGYKQANRQFIYPLPIRRVETSDTASGQIQHALVSKVRRMLELQERLAPIRDTLIGERNDLLHEIASVDSDIDNLVYEIYGLTSAEKHLVEGDGTS